MRYDDFDWQFIGGMKRQKPRPRYYLAYGSNLNMFQMLNRCPGAHRRGWGELRDYELLFKGSQTGAYLTVEPKAGGVVPIGVYTVTPEDERKLDRYEGYPMFYYKKEIFISFWDQVQQKNRKVKAFIYIMHEDRKIGIPSQRYVKTCVEGYEDFNFDANILLDAAVRSQEAVKEAAL